MMQEYESLKRNLHQRALSARSIERHVESTRFSEAFVRASDVSKKEAELLIREQNLDGLIRWTEIQTKSAQDFGFLPVRDLRALARRLRIRDYKYLPKASLLSEIAKKQPKDIPNGEQVDCQDRPTPSGNEGPGDCGGGVGAEIRCPFCRRPWDQPNGDSSSPQLLTPIETSGIPSRFANLEITTTRSLATV